MTGLAHVAIPAMLVRPASGTLLALKRALAAGQIAPYLGSGLFRADETPIPLTPRSLAQALHAKAPVPAGIRSNLWSAAQFIESRRHRKTLTALMKGIFTVPAPATPLHRALAKWPVPLIVDTWYDGAMRAALIESGRTDWGEIQGSTRAGEFREIWTRAYDASGRPVDPAAARTWATVLYKPHGAVAPAGNFLVSDSDYVEVLTEIDIQTPIPEVVQERRSRCGFLFVGARFNDQMLRIFARQITKRSGGRRHAIAEHAGLTNNERRFLQEADIELIDCPVDEAIEALATA